VLRVEHGRHVTVRPAMVRSAIAFKSVEVSLWAAIMSRAKSRTARSCDFSSANWLDSISNLSPISMFCTNTGPVWFHGWESLTPTMEGSVCAPAGSATNGIRAKADTATKRTGFMAATPDKCLQKTLQ